MSALKDLIESPHPIYSANVQYWNFLLQSYEGGKNYCNADVPNSSAMSLTDRLFRIFANGREVIQSSSNSNLFRHPKERSDDYNDRARMSFYYNFCAPIIDIYTNHLFKEAVLENFGVIKNTVQEISENIDIRGSSISEFRKEMAEVAQLYGHCFVMVDSPNVPESEILTRQDQINRRVFPYASIHSPQSVINWSLDTFGMPYWVLVKELAESNIDPMQYDKNNIYKWRYRLWTRDEWFLYDQEYNLIQQGVHGLGVVPIVCVFNKKSKTVNNFLGVSDLADIAFIARDIYNSCSELKQILRDQTFAFLAIQGTSDEYQELSVGVSKALLYPEGRNAPQYVSPPPVNAEVYFNHIDRQVRKIFQLAKLEGGSAQQEQVATIQSGVSKAWDFNETNSALSNKSTNFEDGESKIWQMFSLWEGKEFDGMIQYPNDFSVQSLMDDLTEAEKAFRLQLGQTFDLEVRKAIQKKKFPRATDEQIKQMAEEAQTAAQNNNGNGMLSIRERMPFLFKQRTPNSAVNGG